MRTTSFRGKTFSIVDGSVHPQYSINTFDVEERELRETHWNISPGDVVVDVGSSYGSYTLTALVAGAALVLSFEPEPSVCQDLVRNVQANNWQDRCRIFNQALSDSDEPIDMRVYAPHWPQQTITGAFKATTLDKVVEACQLGRLDWIKIDVEGIEEAVVKGGRRSIDKFRPRLLIECHDFMDPEISKRVKALLPDYRFIELEREPCITLLGEP